jgi:hypothetical protein
MLNRKSHRVNGPILLFAFGLLVLLIGSVAPVAAQSGALVFDLKTTVPVSNLVLFPPSPCNQGIRLTGNFAIGAHIVFPPSPVHESALATLHLDATGIRGTGLTDGAPYVGSQGTSENFQVSPSNPSMLFQAGFNLVPAQPSQYPTDPICPANVSFQTQVVQQQDGGISLSANLVGPE